MKIWKYHFIFRNDPDVQIDEEIGIKLSPQYSRIAIQNARQKIIQN